MKIYYDITDKEREYWLLVKHVRLNIMPDSEPFLVTKFWNCVVYASKFKSLETNGCFAIKVARVSFNCHQAIGDLVFDVKLKCWRHYNDSENLWEICYSGVVP